MSPEQDKWIDVLSGKAASTDDSTRLAEQMRQAFLQRRQQELETPVDEAQAKRIMNALESRGAFQPKKPAAAQEVKQASLLNRLLAWLFPSDGQRGHGARYAWVAAAVLAVVAAPLLLRQQGADDYDNYSAKSAASAAVQAASASIVSARNLEAEATRIESALALHGVKPARGMVNQQLVLTAQVPADKLEAVNRELADWGVAVPADGKLIIMLTPIKP